MTIVGTKVRVTSRQPPKNKQVGKIVYVIKNLDKKWLTYIDYPDGERFVAVDGTDKIVSVKNPKYIENMGE